MTQSSDGFNNMDVNEEREKYDSDIQDKDYYHRDLSKTISSEDVSDNEHDEDDDNDDEEVDESVLSYLTDKTYLKQHAIAIIIAIVATLVGYYHVAEPGARVSNERSDQNVYMEPEGKEFINADLQSHHHHSFRRTGNINICPYDFLSPSESHSDRINRILLEDDDEEGDRKIDSNLQLFDFNLPKEYLQLMAAYYIADDAMDDNYNYILSSNNGNDNDNDLSFDFDGSDDPNFKCLLEASELNKKKSTIQLLTTAYIQPHISTFYKETNSKRKTTKVSIQSKKESDDIKPVSLSFTGFAAKFVNLSAKPLNLYWDSRDKPKLLGTLQPFEALGTNTIPGNTFHVTPLYDKSHVLQRWTITADDAVSYYDPVSQGEDPSKHFTSPEHRYKYAMHKLNKAYSIEYLAKTQRTWLSYFPRPMPTYHMWEAQYISQVHTIKTKQTHYISLPEEKSDIFRRLTYDKYNSGEIEEVAMTAHRGKGELELKLKAVSVAPRVFEVENFLSRIEIDHIMDLGERYNITAVDEFENDNADGYSDSNTDNDGTSAESNLKKRRKNEKKKSKSSPTNAWLHRTFSPIVDTIYRRTADLLQIDEKLLRHRNEELPKFETHHSIAEPLRLARYTEGQSYSAHHDFVYPSISNRFQPARFVTILFYLTEGSENGGETVFPRAVNAEFHDGISVVPKVGKALLIYNILPDGNMDDYSQHRSEVVKNGDHWIANLWVWDPIID